MFLILNLHCLSFLLHLNFRKQILSHIPVPDSTPSSASKYTESSCSSPPPLFWLKDFVHQATFIPVPPSHSSTFTPANQSFVPLVSNIHEPTRYTKAACDTNWIMIMQQELQALEDNNTWVLITLPKGKKARLKMSV